jgi:subtilisin family serine protease
VGFNGANHPEELRRNQGGTSIIYDWIILEVQERGHYTVAKKELVIAFVLLFILGFTTGSSTNETMNQGEMRINVGLRSLSSKAEVTDLTSQYGGKMIRELAPLKVLTFKVPRVVFEYMVFDENLSNLVEYIEEDYMRQIDLRDYEVYTEGESTANVELLPNDPGYQFQWGPPCIGAEDGWDVELGSPDTIVAVVDTGIDLDHPECGHLH